MYNYFINLIEKLNTPIAVIVVSALVIPIVGFSLYRYQPAVAPRSDIQRAIFLGDSYTEGAGASSSDHSYIRYAGKVAGLEALPAAQSGTGIVADAGGENGKKKFGDRLATTVSPKHPDVVVIAGGINDAGVIDRGNLTLADYRAEYGALIADIKTGLPEAKIVVLGPFCPESPNNNPTLKDIRDANRAAAQEARVPFIDVFYFDDENKSSYISADGIHPNDAGHKYIGGKLGANLVEALRQYSEAA